MQPFRFFDLPTEIRSMILDLVLPQDCVYQPVSAYSGDETTIDLPVLTASHQMYQEALPIFYGRNTFNLYIVPRVTSLISWTIQPAHQLAYLRKVHVYVHMYRGKLTPPTKNMIDEVVQTLKKCSNLIMLAITISFISVKPLYVERRRTALCANDVVEAFGEVKGPKKVRIRY